MRQFPGKLAYAALALKPGHVPLRALADHAPINYVRAQAIPGQLS